jgi:hypothetical protein
MILNETGIRRIEKLLIIVSVNGNNGSPENEAA